jgi:SAM-dependent methyltransferase
MQCEGNATAYDMYRDRWEAILPDGLAYNHWGGKVISERLIRTLNVESWHSVLDVCCGAGGTLSLLPKLQYKCGIDISLQAVEQCKKSQGDGQFICGDAHSLPFETRTFDRIFCQDADVWMEGKSRLILGEVARVVKRDGAFVFQNYVRSTRMPFFAETRTRQILQLCGFRHTHVLAMEELDNLFRAAGLLITSKYDLHEDYVRDNARMLAAARSSEKSLGSLQVLLEWESTLFHERWWTGVMVVAQAQ